MLRIYLLQNWFGYSDPGMEETVYDIEWLRHFSGLRPMEANILDETSIFNFSHLLETHNLTEALFAETYAHLSKKRLHPQERHHLSASS